MKKVLIISLLLLAVVFAYASWNPVPDFSSKEIIDKQQEAINQLTNEQNKLGKTLDLNTFGTATYYKCFKVSNEIDYDGYLYRCAYQETTYFGFDGSLDKKWTDLHEYLDSNSWRPRDKTTAIPFIVDNYLDAYGTILPGQSEVYLSNRLPHPEYLKDNGLFSVEFSTTERDSSKESSSGMVESAQSYMPTNVSSSLLLEQKKLLEIFDVVHPAFIKNKYLIASRMQKVYYQVPLNPVLKIYFGSPLVRRIYYILSGLGGA